MTTEELEDCVYETDFFLRYLKVTLQKYQEDPCEAIHDAACNLNDPDCFEAHKVLDRSTKKWMHRPEFVNALCNCRIKAVIEAIYDLNQKMREPSYAELIGRVEESWEVRHGRKPAVKSRRRGALQGEAVH